MLLFTVSPVQSAATPSCCRLFFRNREMLTVKAALEEWHHWLEGVWYMFTILTDHKNLEYIR